MPAATIEPSTARMIEQEAGVPEGFLAANREESEAERIYLSVPRLPVLAVHVDYLPMNLALLIYEQDHPGAERRPSGFEAGALNGAGFATTEQAADDVRNQWAGLTIARQGGLKAQLGEEVAITVTGWVSSEPGRRYSWSMPPHSIRNIFQGASRTMLLGPKFADVPSEEKGMPSPGKYIQALSVQSVMYIHSILYQGVSSLQMHDGVGLMRLASQLMTTPT